MSGEPVDCTEIRDALLAGSAPAGPGVEDHLRGCEGCAELLRGGGSLGRILSRADAPDAEHATLWASVEGALRAEQGPRAWLRSRVTPVRLLIVVIAALVVVGVGGLAAEPSGGPIEPHPIGLGAFTFAGIACLWAFLTPTGRPRVRSGARLLLVLAALVLPFAFAVASRAPLVPAGGSFAELAVSCFTYGSLLAVPFLAVVWAVDRGDRPAWMLSAAIAAVAGLVANAALVLHCGNTEPAHLAAGHAGIGVFFVALGALWVGMVTRRS
jgi:hypothetical protein